jgi:hypothetical protein
MDDDFNTPQALGALFDLARVLHAARDQVAQGVVGAGTFLMGVAELVTLARVLGLLEAPERERAPIDPNQEPDRVAGRPARGSARAARFLRGRPPAGRARSAGRRARGYVPRHQLETFVLRCRA